jgi:hypothetical protein
MSSAEALVLMLSQGPLVTTMGDRTAGSSGNPRSVNAGAGITVNLPRWNDLDADGKPFDVIGIRPDIVVETTKANFSDKADPVLAAALDRLRAGKKFEGNALRLRAVAHHPNESPRVVAVSPARGAVGIDPVTEIRVRFDRPMDPESFCLEWKNVRRGPKIDVGFRLRDVIRFEADSNEFVFPVRLTPGVEHRIEVVAYDRHQEWSMHGFFRSAAGAAASAYQWQFRTRTARPEEQAAAVKGPMNNALSGSKVTQFANESERAPHITQAGRSAALHTLVAKVRH